MLTNSNFKTISRIIRSHIPETREIILFGSHARGEAMDESDIDIAVLVERKLERKAQLSLLAEAWKALGGKGYRVDIIIKTVDDFERDKNIPITFSHTIREEGKSLWKKHMPTL